MILPGTQAHHGNIRTYLYAILNPLLLTAISVTSHPCMRATLYKETARWIPSHSISDCVNIGMGYLSNVVFCALFGLAFGQRTNSLTDPCQSKTRTAPHETQCDAYYECYDGQPYLQHCPNGLVYHGKRTSGLFGVCDYDFNVDCITTPERNPPIATEHCDWLYGIFGHETSCTRYWTCWNGTSTEQFCIGGLLYNEETHACDWPQNVQGCQKHPLCKDDPNANVPLGQSCERYWSCQGGYPRLQRCPATLVFDKISRRCVAPPTEDCEVPPLPPPTEEPESQFRSGGGPARKGSQTRTRQQVEQPQQFQEQSQQHQFIEEVVEEPIAEEPRPRPNLALARPRRPPQAFNLPGLPQGAIPINFNNNENAGQFRPSPIEGAIPLN